MKLAAKISLFIISIVILSSIGTGFVEFYFTQRDAIKENAVKLEGIASIQEGKMNQILEKHIDRLKGVSSRTKLRSTLEDYNQNPNVDDKNIMRRIITDAKSAIDDFIDISIVSLSGDVISSTNKDLENMDYSSEEFFLKGKEKESLFFCDKEAIPFICLSGPLLKDNKLLGVAVINSKASDIIGFTEDYTGLGETGETVLGKWNEEGDAVFLAPRRFEEEDEKVSIIKKSRTDDSIIQALLKNEGMFTDFIDYRNRGVISATRYIELTNWGLVVKQDKSEILKPSLSLLGIISIVNIILILIFIIFALLLSSTISNPVKRLVEITGKVGKGKFKVRAIEKTGDEIEELSKSINNMIIDLEKYHHSEIERSKELEKDVGKKTKELDKRLHEAEDARSATMNILEDVDEARKQLEIEDIKKNELFNITSHELKTPLVPIKGYLDLIEREKYGPLSKKQKESLGILHRNVYRLGSLIDDVLDIARLQSKKMKFNLANVSLNNLVKDSFTSMSQNAKKEKIKLGIQVPKETIKILADYNRIMQAVNNLVKNALKFTPPNGTVIITLKKHGSDIILSVKDTGIGIEKDKLEKVFERFFQVDSSVTRKYGGTGLGLAISKSIAEVHGGTLYAESAGPGKGSEFIIKIPMKGKIKKEGVYEL